MTKRQALPRWRMSTRPPARTVIRLSFMQPLIALMCVHALALGLAVQGVVAGPLDGLRLVGTEYHAKDFWAVHEGFAVQPSANLKVQWAVPDPGGKGQEIWKGEMCYTPEELIALFRKLPAERTARGMFITGELTHLEDLEASKERMTNYQKTKLITNPEWMAAHRQSIQDLVAACEKAKIDVWINLNLGGENLRFKKLTK